MGAGNSIQELKKRKCLIVVGVQNDFITGALRNEAAIAAMTNVLKKVKEYIDRDSSSKYIVVTQDTYYDEDYPVETIRYLNTLEGKNITKI